LGLGELGSVLRRHRRIALDTSIFIYHLESNSKYVALTQQIFSLVERHRIGAITSTMTMTELLVQPYRILNERRVDQFYGLLTTFPNLAWIAPSLEIADLAAQLRAAHNLRTPDALQAATALHEQATALITNDLIFDRIRTLEIVVLDRFL
jgi:uncharacterized protein